MRAGGWPSIFVLYLFGVLGVASLSKLLPLEADLRAATGASLADFGLLMSALALPPALLAGLGGGLVDRVGARRVLVASAGLGALADVGLYFAGGAYPALMALRLVDGLAMVGCFTGAPALMMSTTEGRRRTAAMALWSTYTPVGFSAGLALAAPFAAGVGWRTAFLVHGALFLGLGALALTLPTSPRAAAGTGSSLRERARELAAAFAQAEPLKLAAAYGGVVFALLGVSTLTPGFLVRAHHLSAAQASNVLAVANFCMIPGAFATSWLMGRGHARRAHLGLAAVGVAAGAATFAPGAPLILHAAGLGVFLFACGGGLAFMLAVLPEVIDDPHSGGVASGVFAQVASAATFLTPPVWLASQAGGWPALVALAAVGWGGSLALLPQRARRFARGPQAADPAPL